MRAGAKTTLVFALLLAGRWTSAHAETLHRFAVVMGNDRGGGDTRPLLYAGADARKVYDILTRLGGVQVEDANLIVDGSAGDLQAALGKVERQAAEATRRGEKTALFFYYSGHAKDGALRLGDTRLPIETLKALVAAAPVDIRIAILDSCRSGAMTRSKGARKAPAFQIESESPRDAKGLVILTSSASDEDSQESDLIGGSYFSHHLASGLLGGADRSGDGRVTLFEAYAYAYERTVADTADSAAGAQHPTFSYDLAGNGDLVLTDVASRHEGIYLPRQAPSGVYFMVDGQGFVAAEINKGEGVDRRVALAPGRYRVKRRLGDRLRVGELD
ncbi:MAG TPA: caspase family protein, partial [Polyangia bacterium]|nr:caspase family protein [Polyangia bacterium]